MTEFQKYIQRYLDLIPSDNWLEEMINSGAETIQIFSGLDNEKSLFAYAEGKWTLKELLLHLIDTEKIFQYRALRFARKDQTELSGFDEDFFVANSFANDRTLVSLLEEFRIVRQTTIIFFENLQNAALTNTGKANGNEISVETIGKLIVGHNFHHLKVIEERYLPSLK